MKAKYLRSLSGWWERFLGCCQIFMKQSTLVFFGFCIMHVTHLWFKESISKTQWRLVSYDSMRSPTCAALSYVVSCIGEMEHMNLYSAELTGETGQETIYQRLRLSKSIGESDILNMHIALLDAFITFFCFIILDDLAKNLQGSLPDFKSSGLEYKLKRYRVPLYHEKLTKPFKSLGLVRLFIYFIFLCFWKKSLTKAAFIWSKK